MTDSPVEYETKTKPFGALVHEHAPDWGAFNVEWLFPRVWGDMRLSKRERSLVTIAILSVTRGGDALSEHMRRAIAHGADFDKLRALVTHIALYGGYAAGEHVLHSLDNVSKELIASPCTKGCCRESV